jgi:DNA-binding NarL/FixJ family response regulator
MQRMYGGAVARRSVTRASAALIDGEHRVFCEALLAALRATLSLDAVGTAGSLAEALEELRRTPRQDLVLVELSGPDADPAGGFAQLARATPGAAILVVSPPHERRTIAAVLRIGSGAPAWGGGGCTVATDGSWARTPIAADARSRPSTKEDPAPDERDAADLLKSLTPQQARILELVCEGKFNKQIAYSLDISEGTVKAHLTAILRKLKVQNRTQAVVIAQNARFTATARDMRGGAPARRG